MTLDERFSGLKSPEAPDLWTDVEQRVHHPSTTDLPRHLGSRRVGSVVSRSVAAVAVAAVFLWAFIGLSQLGSAPGGLAFAPGQVARYPVPGAQPLVFGGGAAWVSGGNQGWSELWRVDAATGQSKPLPNTRGGQWPAFGEGFAWVTCSGNANNPCGGAAVLKLDPTTGATLVTIPLASSPRQITTGLGSVWVSTSDGVVRIDPVQAKIIQTLTGVGAADLIGTAGGRVWVTSSTRKAGVVAVDPKTGTITDEVPYVDPCLFAVGEEGVFVASCGGAGASGNLVRIDPRTGKVTYSIPLPGVSAGNMTLYAGRLWLGSQSANQRDVLPIDPATGRSAGLPIPVPAGGDPFISAGIGPLSVFMAGGADSLWVTHVDANHVIRVGIPMNVAASPSPATTPPDTQPPSWVIQQAQKIATQNEDPNPTSAEWVLTSAKLIASAVGLTPGQATTGREYLVVLYGHFTDRFAYTPPGVPAPTGTVITFTLDLATHQVNDFTIGDQMVDVPGLRPFTLTFPGTPSPASSMSSAAATAAAKAAALAGSQRLVALVRVPTGSKAVSTAPVPALQKPATVSASPYLASAHRWWTTPLAPSDALAWLRAHPPAGLHPQGSGSGATTGGSFTYLTYTDPAANASESATLLVEIAADGQGSALRADSQTLWGPPRTAVEQVPTDVQQVDLLAYQGKPSHVLDHATLSGAAAQRFARIVDGLSRDNWGPHGCTLDTGLRIQMTFPTQQGPLVFTDLPACGTLTVSANGTTQPALRTDHALRAALSRELRLPSAP